MYLENISISSYSSLIFEEPPFDYSIDPSAQFGTTSLNYTLYANSVISTETFGTHQLNSTIYVESIASTANLVSEVTPPLLIYPQIIYLNDALWKVENSTIQQFSSNTIQEGIDSISNSIESAATFGTYSINQQIAANPTEITTEFGTPQFNYIVYPNEIISTLIFGNDQLNMSIQNVPVPAIESEIIIPNPTMVHIVRPLSINTTVNFGTANFIDNIHRVLVFKNGNISKMGDNDAGVIAGQIRVNPASTRSNTASSGTASLPENPEGYLSVHIAGKDYKIPYYNV